MPFVLLVAAILTFLVSDVPLTANGRLPTLVHLLGIHYLNRPVTKWGSRGYRDPQSTTEHTIYWHLCCQHANLLT